MAYDLCEQEESDDEESIEESPSDLLGEPMVDSW